jgi:hypothetical protein
MHTEDLNEINAMFFNDRITHPLSIKVYVESVKVESVSIAKNTVLHSKMESAANR